MSATSSITYMKTLKLYSKIKSNQRKGRENKRNHTRVIMIFIASIIAIFYLCSCATNKESQQFKSNEDAVATYRNYLSDLKKSEVVTTEKFIRDVNSWIQVRDSVYTFIVKNDSTYQYSLTENLGNITDSIQSELCRISALSFHRLIDVFLIKRHTSKYNNEKKIQEICHNVNPFFSTLDDVKPYDIDSFQALVYYRNFLAEMENESFDNVATLENMIRIEDRIFNTFLSHIAEYADMPLSDITAATDQLCRTIYQNASEGRLDPEEVLVYMSMRTNRRLINNAKVCYESVKRDDPLSEKQLEAFYWMIVQPFVSIDNLGITLLTQEQETSLLRLSDEIHRLEGKGKINTDSIDLTELCQLILRLYLTTI